jgi:hypothetical protein
MQKLMVVLALLVGCNGRGKQCQRALDDLLEKAPQRIRSGASSIEGGVAQIDAMKQGEKEVAAMRERFVDVCKKADKFDADCYIDEGLMFDRMGKPASEEEAEKRRKRLDECRKIRKAIDDVVFAGI